MFFPSGGFIHPWQGFLNFPVELFLPYFSSLHAVWTSLRNTKSFRARTHWEESKRGRSAHFSNFLGIFVWLEKLYLLMNCLISSMYVDNRVLLIILYFFIKCLACVYLGSSKPLRVIIVSWNSFIQMSYLRVMTWLVGSFRSWQNWRWQLFRWGWQTLVREICPEAWIPSGSRTKPSVGDGPVF